MYTYIHTYIHTYMIHTYQNVCMYVCIGKCLHGTHIIRQARKSSNEQNTHFLCYFGSLKLKKIRRRCSSRRKRKISKYGEEKNLRPVACCEGLISFQFSFFCLPFVFLSSFVTCNRKEQRILMLIWRMCRSRNRRRLWIRCRCLQRR